MKREVLRRKTRQREIILEELRKTNLHPTADMLFRVVRRRLSAISFGTVYRNLNLLRDKGKILELARGRYSCHYDGDTRGHYHFFCLKCKNIFDVHLPVINNLDKKVSERLRFQVEYHRIEFYGYCKRCRRH
ncbi:MAG: transcriptional repressor [Candidatus Omnitrophota bacterium]|nr:transcriptional repressor [Candidatus Omnitrophota bacterium]